MDDPSFTKPISIPRSAGVVGLATATSRILGCLRDVLIAACLGSGPVADAFIVAFRIPNLLRRLFGEGTLAAAVVPVFTASLAHQDRTRTKQLGSAIMTGGGGIAAAAALLALIGAPLLIFFLAPGFYEASGKAGAIEKWPLAVDLARIMAPYIFFIGMGSLSMGILNSYGHFTTPALAPALLNLTLIIILISAAFFGPLVHQRALVLAWGVLAGGFIQMAIQLPGLTRRGVGLAWPITWRHSGLRDIAMLWGPSLLGTAGYQINVLVGTLLASWLPTGSITALYYADRLVQLPLGIFIVALATACLPVFSRQVVGRDEHQLARSTADALGMALFVAFPAMAGLVVLREPIVVLIFQHGAFNARAASLTADALLYYAMGISALALIRLINTAFLALKEMRVPLQATMMAVVLNLVLGIWLRGPMGHAGLALAATLAALINCFWLLWGVGRRIPGVLHTGLAWSAAKSALGSALMGLSVAYLNEVLYPGLDRGFLHQTGVVLFCIVMGIGIYGALAVCLRCSEFTRLKLLMRSGLFTQISRSNKE